MDSKIREIESALGHNRYVEAYNHAVDLYNSEDYPGAVQVLENLLATLPEGPRATSARALLDDARRAMEPQ